jgi:hypothetical protein
MHQIYEVDPTSPRELAQLTICFHIIWPSLIYYEGLAQGVDGVPQFDIAIAFSFHQV